MEKLVKYDSKLDFEKYKSILQIYPYYTALTEDERKIYIKEKDGSYVVINVNGNGEITIIHIWDNNGEETLHQLNDGENKIIAPYGFSFKYDENPDNIVSFDFNNYDFSKVTNMSKWFYSCGGLTSLDLSNFDTSNVTDMGYMFSECNSLTSLDLSKFNTSKVTDMSSMFFLLY